ncbi:MAG: RagB/SusD family nutrient uptake outer membrane protein [Bacteroidales bacterium]
MKQFIKYITYIILPILALACHDELNLYPQDELTEATSFESYDNVKTYAWAFYETFPAYDGAPLSEPTGKDADADLIQWGRWSEGNDYLWDRYKVPTASDDWDEPYSNIRSINIMLDNLENSEMSERDRNHWRSVGLFFRSYEFFDLLKRYGGVPWLEHAITDADEDILFGPRNSRDEVASNILRDLVWAAEHIKPDGDGPNTINQDVVNALLSRFGLFEGTWRKYHELGDYEEFLEASIEASEAVMENNTTLHDNYDEVFNSESLAGMNGILLYKRYVEDELHHLGATNYRSSNSAFDITRKGIDKFLCRDGKTVHHSPLFGGYTDKYAEFRDRDIRLYFLTPPPYKVNKLGAQSWEHTGEETDREYFYEMERISGPMNKELPDLNWNGNVVSEVPNFEEAVFNRTWNGYRFWKIYNELNTGRSSADFADAPIFRLGEVLVNYAEAMFEMGRFDQSVADISINPLRERGEVAPMNLGDITADFDPSRDPEVDPVLWEIRRERAVELMGDGFRREDLRRWKKMDYATEVKLGRWIRQGDYESSIHIQGDAQEGFVQVVRGTPPAFPEHYYLFPIPAEQIAMNPSLEQNPGW